MSIILKPQQWKEPVSMLFPKWCSKSKLVVLISMWFRLVQFLLDQDYNQGSQATWRRKQEAVSRNTNFLRSSVTPALCPQDSTSFRKIFFFCWGKDVAKGCHELRQIIWVKCEHNIIFKSLSAEKSWIFSVLKILYLFLSCTQVRSDKGLVWIHLFMVVFCV